MKEIIIVIKIKLPHINIYKFSKLSGGVYQKKLLFNQLFILKDTCLCK